MIETLLFAIIMLLALIAVIGGYTLLVIIAKTEKPDHPAKKRVRSQVRQSKADRAMERALGKYDGGLRR